MRRRKELTKRTVSEVCAMLDRVTAYGSFSKCIDHPDCTLLWSSKRALHCRAGRSFHDGHVDLCIEIEGERMAAELTRTY